MKRYILVLIILIVSTGCDKDRANWDPTPVLQSVEIINTSCEPYNEINYSLPGQNLICHFVEHQGTSEFWGVFLIRGSGFSDSLNSVNQVLLSNGLGSNDCSISYVTENEIECSFYGFDFSWAGAGTYYVKVKMPDSEWSNSVTFEVY